MGSGVSNLTSDEIGTITKQLKIKYEDLKNSGANDTEFGAQLVKEYNEVANGFTKLEIKFNTNGSKSSKTNKSASSAASNSPTQRKTPHYATSIVRRSIDLSVVKPPTKPGRRRSFAQITPAPKSRRRSISNVPSEVSIPVVEVVLASKSEETQPTTPVAEQPIDSWESVSEQLVCTVCNMTFKTPAFLKRHIKYSDVHQNNVDIANGITKSSKSSKLSKQGTSRLGQLVAPSEQKEGIDYLLYYHGNKFFWRNQKSIDFDIYLHVLPHVFEVIAFDTEKYKPLNRLYLDSTYMEALIEPKLKEAVHEVLVKDRFANEQALRDEKKRKFLITAMLERLQLHDCISDAGSFETHVIFVLQCNDVGLNNPCLDVPPRVLIPITSSINRKRHSTTGEITSFLSELDKSKAEAAHYLSLATKLLSNVPSFHHAAADKTAKIVHECVEYLISFKWWNVLNPIRQKWIHAIRRVIRIKLVGEMRGRLMKLKLNKTKSILRRAPSMRAKEL